MASKVSPLLYQKKFAPAGSIRLRPQELLSWKSSNEEEQKERNSGAAGGSVRSKAAVGKHLRIYVVDSVSGEKVFVPVNLNDTVGEVKEKIGATIPGLLPQEQRLVYKGKTLDDEALLVWYDMVDDACLYLARNELGKLRGERKVKVVVSTTSDDPRPRLFKLEVVTTPTARVLELKTMIETETGYPPAEQRLSLFGRTLENSRSLAEYGVDGTRDEICCQLTLPYRPSQIPLPMLHRVTENVARTAFGGSKWTPGCVDTIDFPIVITELSSGSSEQGHRRPRRVVVQGSTRDTTILQMKEQIAKQMNLEPKNQLLLYKGNALQDRLTADFYNIEPRANLELVRCAYQPGDHISRVGGWSPRSKLGQVAGAASVQDGRPRHVTLQAPAMKHSETSHTSRTAQHHLSTSSTTDPSANSVGGSSMPSHSPLRRQGTAGSTTFGSGGGYSPSTRGTEKKPLGIDPSKPLIFPRSPGKGTA